MTKLTFYGLIEQTLDREKRALTSREIWDASKPLRDAEGFVTSGKIPWNTIAAQIYLDLRRNPDDTPFVQVGKRPTRFTLKKYASSSQSTVGFGPAEIVVNSAETYSERDLHPLLVRYLYTNEHFRGYAKTIYHELSKKRPKGFDEWFHPDMVAVHYPFDDFDQQVLRIQKALESNPARLYSFELKKVLETNNLRESYFQAVSNSSWANEGYLVAANVDEDPDFRDELGRLNNAFGIGVIELSLDHVDESQILLPAKINPQLDWKTIDRLCEDNSNFRDFLNYVENSIKINTSFGQYDEPIIEIEKLEEYKQKKGMLGTKENIQPTLRTFEDLR